VWLVIDAAVNMDDGSELDEGSSFDEVLFDLAEQLTDSGTGEILTHTEHLLHCITVGQHALK